MHFRRPVYSGLMLGFVAAPLAVLWHELGDSWIGVGALIAVGAAVALIPVDVRRKAFQTGPGAHPDSFKGSSLAIGALLPIVTLAIVGLIYLISR